MGQKKLEEAELLEVVCVVSMMEDLVEREGERRAEKEAWKGGEGRTRGRMYETVQLLE